MKVQILPWYPFAGLRRNDRALSLLQEQAFCLARNAMNSTGLNNWDVRSDIFAGAGVPSGRLLIEIVILKHTSKSYP
jgi:hypothetical protein